MRLGGRQQADLAELRAAVGAVPDPELGLPLAELGMLGELTVRGGTAAVTLRCAAASLRWAERLRGEVRAAALTVARVRSVRVELAELTARERVELATALRARSARLGSALGGRTRVYAVASGKGGVGKSTVTANLAAVLAAGGERVAVLDADVWGYSIPQLFGVHENPVTAGGLMLPPRAHGVALMSIGFLVEDGEPVLWRGPMLHKALQQFLADTYWGPLDVLLIDLPPGTGDVTLSVLELLPEAALLAVTTPQRGAHTVAARVVRMAREAGMPIAGVVENMSGTSCGHCGHHEEGLFGSGGGAVLAEAAGAPLLGSVPLDLPLRASGDDGIPVVLAAPESASARALSAIAGRLPVVRGSLAGRALPLTVAR